MRPEALTRRAYIPSFWVLQLGGWFLYALAQLGSAVPEWHQRGYFAYRAMSVPASFVASFLVYGVCKALWQARAGLLLSLGVCASACGLLGLAISAASLWAEIYFGKAPIPFRLSSPSIWRPQSAFSWPSTTPRQQRVRPPSLIMLSCLRVFLSR
jgi:hypothetical protein